MADLLLLILLPLLLLFFILLHASPIKALLTTAKLVLAPELSTVWKPQPASIFVTDHETAHSLLVRGSAGGSFSNRPPSISPSAILSHRQYQNITSAPYGEHWRAIRHNLTSEVLHPTQLHRHASARRRALHGLVVDLAEQRKNGVVHAAESIRYAMFGLVANMCFGDNINNNRVRAMADAQSDLVKSLSTARVFAHTKLPALTRLIYRNRWKKLAALRQQQEETYLPLINSRRGRHRRPSETPVYVDTLIDLTVPDDHSQDPRRHRRRQSDGELVGMCSEFLGAGTETTASALQWIMANLVKRPDIQETVRKEINAIVGADAEEVSEVVLGKLEYLHAVIMEALRLHPPTSFAFRQVMEEDHVVHNGQPILVGTKVYFPLAAIARDMTAWDNPDKFKPQRFLSYKDASQGTDGTIKMMPFGGGRRMCPGRGVAMLHLSYFTANLVREFRWREGEGERAVDLRPHVEFFTVMKRPLRAHLELERTEIKTS
ncbi:cytochrome P450 89A2-like [Triticum dicoccoides]|uniref:cytochrome P450 89A2-like n=1 Tax=Triticum dicoccoides TaxID=85692 RepID=UPI00188FFFF7|nr:cytochrome P450 89A2-like [Triticum dicoccoides]